MERGPISGDPAQVAEVLRDTGLDPARLVLEITESLLLSETETTPARLRQLKALGLRLAIDDFGTGYSSPAYLRRFPVDIIKIDKSFVDEVADDPEAAALSRAIVELGRTLRLSTVAEGIEDPAQLAALRDFGCRLGQGYHFAKPLDPDELEIVLQRPCLP
jgi:EAL domain-containing protein (putative c-di-GMP-specific phosphodiesterase class I)